MTARERLSQLKEKFGPAILRADMPADNRLFVYVEPSCLKAICQYLFRDLDARYVISIGTDDRPFSGTFLVIHDFAFDQDHLLCSVLVSLPPDPGRPEACYTADRRSALRRLRGAPPSQRK
jgi:Ni,Fe-hydrogenase III component G